MSVQLHLTLVYNLRKHGSIRTLPGDLGLTSSRDFYRNQLERQRDLLLGVWRWGFLPFLPGTIVFVGGLYLAPPVGTTQTTVIVVFVAVIFAVVLMINRIAANRLQRMIDQI